MGCTFKHISELGSVFSTKTLDCVFYHINMLGGVLRHIREVNGVF